MRKLAILLLLVPALVLGQKKQITLEDIFQKGTFRPDYVATEFGSSAPEPDIPPDLKDQLGKPIGMPDEVLHNPGNPGQYLLVTHTEPIYRRSSKSFVYFYDANKKMAFKLEEEKILHPSFSPDGSRVAYVKDNNIYIRNLKTSTTRAVTTDGKWNHIINGNCDWVYEEEFEFSQAYQWSPKGTYLAYYRFDESEVKEYSFTIFDDGYNKEYRYKYPKAGEANSKVEIHIYDLAKEKTVKARFQEGDIYIPRIKWTADDNLLTVFWMNRHQDQLKLLATQAADGISKTIYEEKNKYFIEIDDDWYFLKDGKHLLFSSEKEGYTQLFLYSLDGKTKTKLTPGNTEVTEVNGIDDVNKRVFYTMAYPTPMDRNFFVTDFTGKNTVQLTQGKGWHRIELNDDFTRFYDFYSTINTPQVVTLNSIALNRKKEWVATLEKQVDASEKLNNVMNEYELSKAEFVRIPNSKGDTLNGWILKPPQFDPSKKYPVLFCNYGGPGSQQVANRFGAVSFWHQLLAQRGFIVASVDNTGTGFRGEEFKKKTYLQLGKYEIEDQMDAAKFFMNMPFVDPANIGHWGWSYGGFMSSLAITKGADVFSAAVAVAPVTSWRYYDNIYTERYMRTPQENPKGYDDNSPINHTDKIKGKYLIIHGTADDNVHFQNATQMISALIKSNVQFESAYYPNKNHGISGARDNTSFHLWSKMTRWILDNLGNNETKNDWAPKKQKAF